MTDSKITVLDTELIASIDGVCLAKPYRAVLLPGELGAVLSVEQYIRGQWYVTGRWYLSTLLEHDAIPDSLSIDYGQKWAIASGLRTAIIEACLILAKTLKTGE